MPLSARRGRSRQKEHVARLCVFDEPGDVLDDVLARRRRRHVRKVLIVDEDARLRYGEINVPQCVQHCVDVVHALAQLVLCACVVDADKQCLDVTVFEGVVGL